MKKMILAVLLAMSMTVCASAAAFAEEAPESEEVEAASEVTEVAAPEVVEAEADEEAASDEEAAPDVAEDAPLLGGWEITADSRVPEEALKAFAKLMAEEDCTHSTPIACLATQLVAGTNYCLLVRKAPLEPNPTYSYVLTYLYVDLKGEAEILDEQDIVPGLRPEADRVEEPEAEPEPVMDEAEEVPAGDTAEEIPAPETETVETVTTVTTTVTEEVPEELQEEE